VYPGRAANESRPPNPDTVRRILVPYHHAEPLPRMAETFASDDAVIVSKGPAGAMVARLYDQVAARVAASGAPVVVASGDCTTALATVAGLQRRGLSPGVIWLDAHGDFHTPHTTRSGYLGGMALAMLTGRAGASLASAIGLCAVAEELCVLTGARDIDPGERELLESSAVHRVDDVAMLSHATLPPPPWYVHLDIDLIDPAELPPLRFPAPGGPSASTVANALRALASRGTVAALGLACTFAAKTFDEPDPFERIRPLIDAALGSHADTT
jgi:arginase